MSGKMSVGMRRIVNTPRITISIASTMNVYGRLQREANDPHGPPWRQTSQPRMRSYAALSPLASANPAPRAEHRAGPDRSPGYGSGSGARLGASMQRRLLGLADRSPSLRGQRVWKTQPWAAWIALGISPSRRMRSRRWPSMARHGGEQRLGIGMVGPVEDALRGPDLHQPAEIEHGDAVGEIAHDAEIVGDEDIADLVAPPGDPPAG